MIRRRNRDWIWDTVFFFSALAMIRLLALKGDYLPFPVRVAVAVLAAFCGAFGFHMASNAHQELSPLHAVLALPFALISDGNMALGFYYAYPQALSAFCETWAGVLPLTPKRVAFLLGCAALPAVYLCFLWLFVRLGPVLARGWRSLSREEHWYWLISVLLCATAIVWAYTHTSVFYFPMTQEGVFEGYDVIYNTDTGSQIATGIHINVGANQSDIRQPLYGLFAQPVGVLGAVALGLGGPVLSAVVLDVAQVALLQFVLLLLCAMALKKGTTAQRLALMVAMNCSFPFFLFGLNMEQYVLSVFWMLLLVFVAVTGGTQRERDLLYVAAAGSILTSGVLLPLLSKERTVAGWLHDVTRAAGKALVTAGLFARYSLLFVGPTSLVYLLTTFSGVGHLPLIERLWQYSHFVRACFLDAGGVVDPVFRGWPSYQPVPVTGFSILGWVILGLTVLAFLRVRRAYLAKLCFGWVLFSFVILGLIGWGSTETGMVLYTLYFSWAYMTLLAMGVSSLLPPRGTTAIYLAGAAAMAGVNLPGIWKIIQFGINHYGTLPH